LKEFDAGLSTCLKKEDPVAEVHIWSLLALISRRIVDDLGM
jgi:hypothetical protein